MIYSKFRRGDQVLTINAFGEKRAKRALTGVEVAGHDFPVVWVCEEAEWRSAEDEDRDPEGVPWPFEDVNLAD